MVGVPRSKACLTCRKRRKGCDQRRPGCSQCEKMGLQCAGYARELVFVNSTKQPPSCTLSTVALPASLAHSAYEERCLGLFWSTYLPNGRALSSNAVQDTLGGWSNTIRDLYSTDVMLKKAVLALCLATSGKLEGMRWMSEEGLRLYISALQDMSVALKKRSKGNGDSILTTAKLFSLYEAMHGADDRDKLMQAKSWTAHNSGELAILVARGPDQFTEGHAHRLFIDGRQHLTTLALRARKKSILSDAEWKTIPWRNHPKTQKDRLLDIFIEMPTLLELSDILRTCYDPDEKDQYRRKLIDHCWLCDKQITEWYASCPRKELKPFNRDDILIDAEDLGSAHLMTMYWTTCVILYSVLREAVGPDIQLPERANVKIYCQRIIRAVPIFFHPAVGTFRAHLATMPMAVAMKYLSAFPPEERAVEQMLLDDCFSRPEGMAMGKLLKSMELEKLSQNKLDHSLPS